MSGSSLEQFMAQMSMGAGAFDMMYDGARRLKKAEQSGDANKLKELDFSVGPTCIRCSMPCLDKVTRQWKPMKCGGCQAVIYCSRACQVADWKKNKVPGAQSHKELCASNKEHMKRVPYFLAQVKQFPWARVESDGTCSHGVLAARFDVLGSGPAFGYWSTPGGLRPHDASNAHIASPTLSQYQRAEQKSAPRAQGYVHGEVLLGAEWPTDVEAWKMKDEKFVPRLFFTDEFPAPEKAAPGQVKDWKSWYEWRGLPLESPVAMLMDSPLSVYHLLVNVLGVADQEDTPGKRQALEVHFLGVEVELNFLPLFSELALLLPNTDITLTMFGKPPCELVRTARKDYRNSLATNDILWSYTAPRKSGGGSIKIKIHSANEEWTRDVFRSTSNPDAIVALNAGLMSYTTWFEPIVFSTMLDVPFGVTEYAEQSLETCVMGVPKMCHMQAQRVGLFDSDATKGLMRPREYPITTNPFHRPGQRPIGKLRMPNCYNGFCMPVVRYTPK